MNAVHPIFEKTLSAFMPKAKKNTLTKEFYENPDDLKNSNVLNVEVVFDPINNKVVEDVEVWVNNREENCKATVITNIAAKEVHAEINGKVYSLFDFLVKAVEWKEVHNSKENL